MQTTMMTLAAFVVLVLALVLSCASAAYADTFGSGSNMFVIEFVTFGILGTVAYPPAHPHPRPCSPAARTVGQDPRTGS